VRLSDFEDHRRKRSAIDELPDEVRDQLVSARKSGSHGPTGMVRWLHHNPEFGDDYKHVTVNMLDHWFVRNGIDATSE
jgi:hypothetical protein